MKKVAMVVAVLVMTVQMYGCGAARQAAARKDLATAMESMAQEYSDKRLDPIRGKVSMGGQTVIPTAVPDACPNDSEKEAINLLREKVSLSKSKFSEINNKHNFKDSYAMFNVLNETDYNLGRLYKCQLTFQSYAENRQIVINTAEQEVEKVKQQIAIEDQKRAQATAAAFGAALQGAGQAMQQQEAIRQANRPRQTSCTKNGNNIDCTTY